MEFNFPPGFDNLPPEIQENIRKGIIQQYIFNMHLGGEYLKAINEIIDVVMRFVSKEKYKDDPDVKELDKNISDIVNHVKEKMEILSQEE